MLRAALFDWGDTLMQWRFSSELLASGHRDGLEAVGRDELPEPETVTELFVEEYLPGLFVPGTLDEIDYSALVRELLRRFGVELTGVEIACYLDAEHRAWSPARQLGATTHALLESLRSRGLALGLVSNAIDPGWLLHRDLEELGVAERLDVAVFSSEVGRRKPAPEIFEAALDALAVEPGEAFFVGDRLLEDVGGAGELGMTTVQALWFRADEHPDGREPDFQAFTPMDVLNIAARLGA